MSYGTAFSHKAVLLALLLSYQLFSVPGLPGRRGLEPGAVGGRPEAVEGLRLSAEDLQPTVRAQPRHLRVRLPGKLFLVRLT